MFGFLTPRVLFIGALVAAGLFVFGYAMWTAKQSGELGATLETIRQNQEAATNADDARNRFDSGCPDGLRFRSATGRCERITVNRRD